MGKIYIILFYLVMSLSASSQGQFKTIVPQQSVVTGESFQVQYIIQETGKIGNFKAPAFAHFRFVSGPNQYYGSEATTNGVQRIRNFVYTLEAIHPGRYTIHGALAMVNGKPVKSNDVLLEIISKENAAKSVNRNSGGANPDYLLRPGVDPYEKIRQNLFLKLVVDKKSCFAGEPVLATFKLYSRLESKSDIVKNPGFYGFTVYDMVNLSDKQAATENVNGMQFDVHTIRKVQLYPLQAGLFTIDPMEVKNKVEFSHSAVHKKAEQEIVEGMMGNYDNETGVGNKEIFETQISTEPVAIQVKSLPVKNRPDEFNGAVGDFVISAALARDSIAKNEEGFFEITMKGSGNFTQLNAPAVVWPSGMEGFEPVIKDSLDKTQFPLAGRRVFRYAFIGSKAGQYQIQPVSFSFFTPGKKTYKTVLTNITTVKISNEEKRNTITAPQKVSIADTNARTSRVAAGVVILLVIIVLAYWVMYKHKPAPVVKTEMANAQSVEEIFNPARKFIHTSDQEFYAALYRSVWNYLGSRFDLSGSDMNKLVLAEKIKKAGIPGEITQPLFLLIELCETGKYTKVNLSEDKEKLVSQAEELMRKMESYFLQQA